MADATSTTSGTSSSSGTSTPPAASTSADDPRERAAGWFETVYMAAVATRAMAEDAAGDAHTPELRALLERVRDDARRHEQAAVALLAAVGREPARTRELGGVLTAKGGEALNWLYALSDGIIGTWRSVHMLYVNACNSRQAFVVAQRLARAIGEEQAAAGLAPVIEEQNALVATLLETIASTAPRAMLERAPI